MTEPEDEEYMGSTPENIRAWAGKAPDTEWPHQDWDMEMACPEEANLILSLASEDCPQSDFFVSCLYIIVGSCVTTNGTSISRAKIDDLLLEGAKSSNKNVLHWVARSRDFLQNPEQFDQASWMEGGWALDDEIWRFPDEERIVIIEEIHEAFRGVPRGEVTLHEADVWDDYGSEEEAQKARSLDTENSWEEIPDEWIENCGGALAFYDPQSWQYYIPAYMIWTLKNFQISDSITADWTIYTFDFEENDPQSKNYHMERFHQLDQKQSAAVSRFLQYMSQDNVRVDGRVAGEALRKYWKQFDPTNEN
ncbi:MAG: hypothetical protein KDA77_19100 [Planctomycetaceae bacterium]|nr:hypothetical protein [Planctomycetaceae bacterium]